MKKVSFITIHVGANYGSVLQTIATSAILKLIGTIPVCVNYIPPRVTSKRYWKDGRSSFKKLARRIMYFPFRGYTTYLFQSYLKKYVTLSCPIYKEDDFGEKCPLADIYLTGSDQVWNFTHNEGYDCHYFFEGVDGKKVTFSSSIGMGELSDEQLQQLKNGLLDYSAISVREQSAVELLEKQGFTPELHLDPTFMLTKDEWLNYSSKRIVVEPYLFVYLPYNTIDKESIYNVAYKIAKRNGLKIVTISSDIFKDKFAQKTIINANPGDFLSLMLYSEIVITNSFHGTAFSVNLNKNFWVFMPSAFSTRIYNILEMFSLRSRLLKDDIQDYLIDNSIDFSRINDLLEGERNKAKDYLTRNIV